MIKVLARVEKGESGLAAAAGPYDVLRVDPA